MAQQTTIKAVRDIAERPAAAYGVFDTEPRVLAALRGPDGIERIAEARQLDPELVARAADLGDGWPRQVSELVTEHPDLLDALRRLYATTVRPSESPLHITGVVPDGPVTSFSPFDLMVRFQNLSEAPVVAARAQVSWAGDPFVIEQVVESADDDTVRIAFDSEHALPVGTARVDIRLYRADGASSAFTRTMYVLPSNPLSLRLAPAGARVTGTWSARGDYRPDSDTFLTEIELSIANGDAGTVSMNRRVSWQFWDGGVGTGTLIEGGAFDWPSSIDVAAHSTWRGSISFTSPRGSGIFGVYDRKEDLAIAITMTAADGRSLNDRITARVMLSYGVNVIKVGDFGAQEHVDLYAAIDAMRQIYERRDITLRGVDRRRITAAAAGGYTVLDSEDEFRDLLEDWSVPNNFIDVFVVRQFNWGGFNGFAGDIPGPAAKGGRRDGIAADRTGYTDASGTARLNVTTLSQLIGHEIGHYLGLQHLENTNNLMRSNTGVRGPDLDYDQYRTMFPHGYMFYE
ncbi:hypothetical protein [Nocardia sp. NPDC050710]|uniref:hypothetical protein n=1 Tax=Nocardia sp. NPDC050710 TaxID=3157220 RepID=UPI0033F6D24C